MLSIKHKYSNKEFFISPYNTAQEKDLLLLSAVENISLDAALRICKIENSIINSLSQEEKVAFLYKLREISVGDQLLLKFKCKHCNTPTDNKLSIDNIIKDSNIKNKNIKDVFKIPNHNNIQEFSMLNIDEMSIDEYDKLYREIKDTVTGFEFVKPIICQKCKGINHIKIDDPSFVIENMSEDSLTSIYQSYNDLVFHGNYSKLDIDSMYPFERIIFIGLMNKTKEDLNG